MELNAVNIAVPAGERVVIRGKEADGVAALKKVLARRGKWQDQTG
jgi:ABC-type phosphate/phosphonate transport system ATPase subunit